MKLKTKIKRQKLLNDTSDEESFSLYRDHIMNDVRKYELNTNKVKFKSKNLNNLSISNSNNFQFDSIIKNSNGNNSTQEKQNKSPPFIKQNDKQISQSVFSISIIDKKVDNNIEENKLIKDLKKKNEVTNTCTNTSNSINSIQNKKNYNTSNNSELNNLKIKQTIKVRCIFRRNVYTYILNINSKFNKLIDKFCKELSINKENLQFHINNKLITECDKNINELITEEKTNEIYIYKKMMSSSYTNGALQKRYNNFVIIEKINDITLIKNELDKFLDEYHIEKDYICEKIGEDKYSFGFCYPDLAFDFNRLVLLIKSSNSDLHGIKNRLKIENKSKSKNKLSFNRQNKLKNELGTFSNDIRKKNKDYGLYVNICGPYVSYQEVKNKEQSENKKKWITEQGFKP